MGISSSIFDLNEVFSILLHLHHSHRRRRRLRHSLVGKVSKMFG